MRLKFIITVITALVAVSCAAVDEPTTDKWIIASTYLPREKLSGLQHAGFFEINDAIYSHHCDSHGNMIRMKYNEENNTWKQIKYETLGCGGDF